MASQTITALGNAIINLVDRKTPIATASTVGMVKPDGSTINIDANGVISSNGGGTSRNIGEIVASTVPLTDAGLHLLDGALIDGAGIYSDFVSYMADLYGDGTDVPNYFCSQADWETAVTTYGVCGKFVYNSTNGTVRLPKITGIVEGTTDVTALGDLVEAGLPNITGTTSGSVDYNAYVQWDILQSPSGALYGTNSFNAGTVSAGARSWTASNTLAFDASRSNSVYGNSSTVQPQAIKVLYYIVIATSTKTSIQVDIDEVATDLNGKVDKADLQEVQCVVETYRNGDSWYRVWSDGWCEQGGRATVPSGSNVDITFLKPFINTNYWVNGNQTYNWAENPGGFINAIYGMPRTTGFSMRASSGPLGSIWQACGYII